MPEPTTTPAAVPGVPKVDAPAGEFGSCNNSGCSATAYVEVRKVGGALLLTFCAHHYRAREEALAAAGFFLNRDARHLLEVTP